MVESIFSMLTDGIGLVEDIFNDLMDSTGMLPIVIGIICLAIFFRLIVTPLFAGHLAISGRSDSVSRYYHYDDSNITVKEVR